MVWGLSLVKTDCSTNEVRELIALRWPSLQNEKDWKIKKHQKNILKCHVTAVASETKHLEISSNPHTIFKDSEIFSDTIS